MHRDNKEMPINEADQRAVDALVAAQPAWTGIRTAAEAVDLAPRTLLHCGPPAHPPHALVVPTLNSAAVACVFEGWARDLEEGLALVRSGDIRFEAAQPRRVATPMAAVVSPSMRLIEMTDLARPSQRAYAPINGGGSGGDPAPRYGRCTPAALEFLRFLNADVAQLLDTAAGEPLAWLPIVDAALVAGDDVHLRHVAAHGELMRCIGERIDRRHSGSTAGEFIGKWPFFHLNFWMAGVRVAMAAATGVAGSAVVTAFGGNGAEFGLQVSGLPGRWFTCPATPPLGAVRAPHTVDSGVGAYGDSALVEAFGLGALAHAYSPEMRTLHRDFYHADLLALPAKLLLREHPGLPLSRARCGLSARRVLEADATPVVELGIVDRAGIDGGLGAGLYRPPMAPFAAACGAMDGGT
jgi:hypothetical protein